MRLFACPVCGATLYFHNRRCGCGAEVAYAPDARRFVLADAVCTNREPIRCNWVAGRGLCAACAMTAVVPDAFHDANQALWAEAEAAKRWVLATLHRRGWFTAEDAGPRPVFHLLSEHTSGGPAEVSMGHQAGVVTINVVESDPAEVVRRREALGEPYRTITGHFRHELAHFLFERLAPDPAFLEAFRAVFGDERADYGAALAAHYRNGPPSGWPERHITAYASAHPHEDWAETVAHLLHLTDMVDSAAATGLRLRGLAAGYDAYVEADAERLIALGVDHAIALNHVTRAIGHADVYPFVLRPLTRAKLAFAHRWLKR